MTEKSWTANTVIDIGRRGEGISEDQNNLVKQLKSQAFALQERVDLAERSSMLLACMIGPESESASSVNGTYEAHSYNDLRFQLFRLIVIDICAAILDKDSRTGSIRSVLKELRRDTAALDALRAYFSDTSCLNVTVDSNGLSACEIEELKEDCKNRHAAEKIEDFDKLWEKVDQQSDVLNSDQAQRLKWARNKVIAHYETSEDGLIALDDDPSHGEGKLSWAEPIEFLDNVRDYVYDVILLLTANSWSSNKSYINKFYATVFWDRFKNGSSNLKPNAETEI